MTMLTRPALCWKAPPVSRGGGRPRGFTLIELIMVIVMLGVLAVFAAPRIFNTGEFNARGFRDETLGLLRYAQKTAIAQRRVVCVAFDAGGVAPGGAVLTINADNSADNSCEAAVPLANMPRGGLGMGNNANPVPFQFTPLGSTNQDASLVVTIPNSPNDITVDATTGYVQ